MNLSSLRRSSHEEGLRAESRRHDKVAQKRTKRAKSGKERTSQCWESQYRTCTTGATEQKKGEGVQKAQFCNSRSALSSATKGQNVSRHNWREKKKINLSHSVQTGSSLIGSRGAECVLETKIGVENVSCSVNKRREEQSDK